jgi:RNA ligase (TIGR02306 family)
MERKLASVRKIEEIKPIVGADKICAYRVGGWWVVDAINKYKVGDLAVYYEIDSFLPIRPQFEFLRKSSYKRMGTADGFRLRTIKLRNVLSQGLLTPIPEGVVDPKENDDLTQVLDIVKYEPPIPAQLAGKIKGTFPIHFPKTEETRIQNFESDFSFLPLGERVYVCEKLDGSSATFYYNKGEFGVCSRNWELVETEDNSFWRAAKLLSLKEKFIKLGRNIALQGELLSPGVQGNIYNFKDVNVYFFTAYDIDKHRRMYFDELEWVLFKLDLKIVPILDSNYILPKENLSESMLQYAEGKSALNPDVEREGIVVRGLNKEFSFKAISNKFLLSEK